MLYLMVLGIFVIIAAKAGRSHMTGRLQEEKISGIDGCFFRMAALVYEWFPRPKKKDSSVTRNLSRLNPEEAAGYLRWRYEVNRIKLFLMIVVIGDIAALFMWIRSGTGELLIDGRYLFRGDRGEGSKEVFLTAKSESGEETGTSLVIQECRYEEEELEVLYGEMLEKIYKLALNKNISWDHVTEDLYFMDSLEGYPFALSWSSDNYAFITGSGRVASWKELESQKQAEALVSLHLRAEYFDFIREHTFYARICPAKEEVTFSSAAAQALQEAEAADPYEDKVVLPVTIQGEQVTWSEQKTDESRNIFLVVLVGAAAVWFLQDKDLQKQVQEKNNLIETEYPAIISKLTLYLGAGMNLKGAWCKIAQEDCGARNPIYREMQVTCREMEGGIAEAEAYERFGKRVCRQRYIRLTTLLVQNLKKGNAALLFQLRQEAFLALEDRTAEVKRAGEKIGTKLLLPMLLLMAMVMVLIMVPAFLSF